MHLRNPVFHMKLQVKKYKDKLILKSRLKHRFSLNSQSYATIRSISTHMSDHLETADILSKLKRSKAW